MVTVRVPTPVVRVGLLVGGVAHLLVPRLLLRVAGELYDRVLGVRFEPTGRAPRRVRAVGGCLLVAALVLPWVERWASALRE